MTEPDTTSTGRKKTTKPDAGEQGNVLQNTIFGLPVWMYLVGIGILVLIVMYYRQTQKTSTTDTTSTDTTSASLVPPFINQVYVNPAPPEPSPRPEGPPGLERIIDRPSHVFKTTRRQDNFHKLAQAHGMSDQQLAELNPKLADTYMNTGKPIPKGTQIRIYNHPFPKNT